MATFSKVNDFVLNLCEVVDLDGDAWKFDLTSTAPTAGTDVTADGNGIQANITPISYTNYTDDLTADRTLTSGTLTHTQTSGTTTFDYGADIVITASGGAIASWQYIVLWDDTPVSPVDPVSNYWDHGSAIVLATSETATLAFNASGIWTLT
jgi:hypothetical protein